MIRRPPSSPLFPSPTLSRSIARAVQRPVPRPARLLARRRQRLPEDEPLPPRAPPLAARHGGDDARARLPRRPPRRTFLHAAPALAYAAQPEVSLRVTDNAVHCEVLEPGSPPGRPR